MRRWALVVAYVSVVARVAGMSLGEAIIGAVVAGIVLSLLGWSTGAPARIARWRISRRELLPPSVTPAYLCGLRKDQTKVSSDRVISQYVGKWMPMFVGTLDDLELDGDNYRAIFHGHSTETAPRIPSVFMYFSRRRWGRRLDLMPRGSEVRAIGQLMAVGQDWINLNNCELVEDKG